MQPISKQLISVIWLVLVLFSLLFLRGSNTSDLHAYLDGRLAVSDDLRQSIIVQIWGGTVLPAEPVEVEENVDDPLGSVPNLKRVDQFLINMGNGFVSRPHVFYPNTTNNRLVFTHQGHNSKSYENYGLGDTIRDLVSAGYTVVAFLMPGEPPSVGVHNSYPLPQEGHNALRYFIEPVIRILNLWADQQWELIGMTGISGGGWTTTLTAAIDERIAVSVPVAGSMPTYSYLEGDWEQQLPGLQSTNYLDLYLLAVTNGRQQVQLLNTYDPDVFDYRRYKRIFPYSAMIEEIAAAYGGKWSLIWDDTHHQHMISEFGRKVILQSFEDYIQSASLE